MLLPMLMMTGIVLGIFLGVLLLTLERGNIRANRLLGIIMILSSVCVSDFAISKLGLYNSLPHTIGIAPAVLFLIGPLFLFYIRILMGQKAEIKRKEFLHFVPFILLVLYRLPFYLSTSEAKLEILNHSHFYKLEHKAIILIQTIHVIIYLLVIKNASDKYAKQISRSSNIEMTTLRWIKKCLSFLFIIFGFIVIFYALYFFGLDLHPFNSAIIPLLISVTILSIGFTGLKQPIIFPQNSDNLKGKKYERSTLSEEKAAQYLQKLISLMEVEKSYLKSDLTLQELAECISASPNHLSQVINDKTGQNFFDFINSYRIKYAQNLLSSPQGGLLTIVAIGYEAGFNSKSSFNSAFKKHTGMTPSQYKLLMQKQNSFPEA